VSYFSPETDPRLFACSCGRPGCDAPPPSLMLLGILDAIRARHGKPIVITSGPRCLFWNEHEGGRPDSEHLEGKGADAQCLSSADRWSLVTAAISCGVLRIGIGPDFVHIGIGGAPPHVQGVVWTYYPREKAA
jgi:hypothetical protein